MQSSQVYSVAVGFQDLADEGTLSEILGALQHLENVTANVFFRIENRIAASHQQHKCSLFTSQSHCSPV